MRWMSLTLVLVSALFAAPASSQTASGRGGAYIQAGANWSGLVDRNASALRYQGPGAGAAGGWRGVYQDSRIEVGLAASASRLSSRITSGSLNRESALSVELRLAAVRRVASMPDRSLSFFGGAQLMVSGLGRLHHFPYGVTEKFADIFATLGAAGTWEYRRADGLAVTGEVAVPVVSAVGRTPYYGLKNAPDFQFRGPLALSTVTHSLRLEKPVASRVTLLMDYRTTYLRDDDPRAFRRIEHWLGTGLGMRRRTP